MFMATLVNGHDKRVKGRPTLNVANYSFFMISCTRVYINYSILNILDFCKAQYLHNTHSVSILARGVIYGCYTCLLRVRKIGFFWGFEPIFSPHMIQIHTNGSIIFHHTSYMSTSKSYWWTKAVPGQFWRWEHWCPCSFRKSSHFCALFTLSRSPRTRLLSELTRNGFSSSVRGISWHIRGMAKNNWAICLYLDQMWAKNGSKKP